jgi:TetR/AcrR family transcriptional regulator, cholesterol catabolism regulator
VARKPADQSVSKADILQAAAEVLRQKGYEATTMKDIAAEVDLTAASLYHHFKNKNALMLAVLEGGMAYTLSCIQPIAEADLPAAEKLRQMIDIHVVSLTQHTAVGVAMVFEIGALTGVKIPGEGSKISAGALHEFDEWRERFFDRRSAFEDCFRQVVQAGVDSGEFRQVDVPIFVKTVLGANNWVSVWYRPGGRLDGEAIATQMTETFLRSLEP